MGLSWKEYWSGLLFLLQELFLTQDRTWVACIGRRQGGPSIQFSSVQSLSRVQLCESMDCSTPGVSVHHQLPELTQTHVHWVDDAIQPPHPLWSPSPPAFNLSISIRVFSNESVLCMRWPKYWNFSFSINPNEYLGLNSFRTDWLDLLAVKGTLKSLLQNHSSKASIFSAQPS